MIKPDITGFQRWADFLKALVAVCGMAWAVLVFALDDRYVNDDEMAQLVKQLKQDRVQADIRKVESQIAIAIMQADYAETPEWRQRREQEKQILETQLHSLERELEHLSE